MQKDSKFFDDLAKMATGAASSVLEMKREFETAVMQRAEDVLRTMNLATREEVDTVQAMLSKLRLEQEELKKRLDALEKSQNNQ